MYKRKFVNYKVGYVQFEDVKMAQKCIQQMDDTQPFDMGRKPLKIDFWQSRHDLAKEKEEKW